MKNIFKLLLLCSFLVCPPLWASEDDSAESQGEERWFQVELLIYKQKSEANNLVSEVWPHDISLSYPDTWVRLKTADEYIANPRPHPVLAKWLTRVQKGPYTPFVLQNDSAKTFSKAAKQIQRYEGEVLLHQVWWQPLIQNDPEESPGILIRAGKSLGDHYELEGSIQFKLLRYLHIQPRLWLTEFSPDTLGASDPLISTWPALPLAPDQEQEQDQTSMLPTPLRIQQIVTIQQSRRMRSNETHFIDHPKLGILVRLTPYTEKPKP